MKKLTTIHFLWQVVLLTCLLCHFSIQQVHAQCSGVSESDSLELVSFYHATGGDNWSDNSGWLVAPVKEWKGITLTDDGCYVKYIIITGNNLKGELIDLQLPKLKIFRLHNIDLSGSILNFSNLPNLIELDLSFNDLSGSIPDFSNLPNLEELALNSSEVSGSIPDFTNLPKLTYLNLAYTNISGNIPDFSNLPNLVKLDLNSCEVSGSIPDFSNLPRLKLIWAVVNNLSGTIPDFSNLPNLKGLYLSGNDLSGTIPDFSNLPKLTNLSIGWNDFSGTIPDFSNLPNLIELNLYDNDLSGSIPDFSKTPNLEILKLHLNSLSGTIPDFSNLSNLEDLYLRGNELSGPIPDFSNLSNLEDLDLRGNELSGPIPDFSNLSNLEDLDLGRNELSGAIPDFSNLPNLTNISLSHNKLSSNIPNFSNLPNLTDLYLYNNALSGAIPNFDNIPNLRIFRVCPNDLQAPIPSFEFCPLINAGFLNLSCIDLPQISGHVFYDENANCIKEESEKGIPNMFVYTDDEQFITTTDENGFYNLKTDTGFYSFASSSLNNVWSQTCPAPSSPYTEIFTAYTDSIGNLNYAYEPRLICPQMKVEIGTPILTRCFSNIYTVNYCNIGTATAENASIELYFPEEIIPINSSIPYVQVDDYLIFNIGDVGLSECGSFTVLDSVSCESVLESTACVEAFIYPNDPCEIDPVWSGADLKVKGECLGDSVQFTIKNVGSDMISPTTYQLFKDDLLAETGTLRLASGDSLILSYEATGATYRLRVRQSIGNPYHATVVKVVEGCGDGPFSFGFVNSQWDGDNNPLFDFDCQEIVGSFDPNDKTVYPSGILEGNHIPDSIDLTYRIRFQNTGNAVAYRVIIIDTIDIAHLQLSSLELGAYSHDFELDIKDGNILTFTFDDILLPDSTSNEPESHGFITYTLAQKEGNEIGDLITNEAAIYFDYNEPVITNKVFNTVGIPDTTTADFVHTSLPETILYEADLLANVYYTNELINIQIKQVQAGEQFSLQLFNILGQEVGFIPSLNVPLHQEPLSQQVPVGVYLYRIVSSRGQVAKGKVMVR